MATQAGPLQAWSGLSPGLQRTRWEACVLINTATKQPENEKTHGSDGQQKLALLERCGQGARVGVCHHLRLGVGWLGGGGPAQWGAVPRPVPLGTP